MSVLSEAPSCSTAADTRTEPGDGHSESQFSLRKHKQRLESSGNSKPRPFKTASVFPFKVVNTATKTVSMEEGSGSESVAGNPSDFIGYSTLSKV